MIFKGGVSSSLCLAQVFYMFGAGGLVWAAGWEAMMGGIEAADPATARLLEGEDARHTSSPTRAGAGSGSNVMPWRGMLRNTPVRALAYTHFCNNWCAAARGAPNFLRRVPLNRGVRLRPMRCCTAWPACAAHCWFFVSQIRALVPRQQTCQ